ncbi:MAG: MFS transporter [Atribacterota bacterium]
MERRTVLRLSVIVGIAFFFLAVSMLITGAVLPRWIELFRLSATRAGRLFSLYYLPYVVTTFVSGALCDLFGKKPILVLSQAFLALGFFVVSLAENFPTIEWGIFLAGIGGGFCEAPLTGLLSQVFPGREGAALNLSQISFGLGAAVGPYLAGFLLARNVSFRVLYFIPGVFSVLLFWLLLRERELFASGNNERFSFENLKALAPFATLLGASFLAIFLYVGAEIGSSAWMSTYFVRELGQSIALGGAAMGIFWGTMTVGRLIFGVLARRISYLLLLRVATLLSLFALLALNVMRQVPFALLSLLVLGFGFAPIWPLIVAWVAKHTNKLQATAIGLTVASGGLGALFFPWFMGVVADGIGLRWVFLVALVLVVGLLGVVESPLFRRE